MPMNVGGLMTLYFVNDSASVASIGPSVKISVPMSHGSRKMNAQRVCSDTRQRRRSGTLALATAIDVSSFVRPWSGSSRPRRLLGRVDRVLRFAVRLGQRVLGADALVQHAVHRVLPDPLELLGRGDRRE